MNITQLNFSNQAPTVETIDLSTLCPKEHEIFQQFYKLYIVIFALWLFTSIFIYIWKDIQLNRMKKDNEQLLKGYIKESD